MLRSVLPSAAFVSFIQLYTQDRRCHGPDDHFQVAFIYRMFNSAMKNVKRCAFAILLILLSGCDRGPSANFTTGDVLLRETFETADDWDGRQAGYVQIGVSNDAYRMQLDVNSYVRGFYQVARYDNVVIDVRAVTFSENDNNAFGIICRGERSEGRASGYYFLIGSNGSYSIRKGEQEQVNGLFKWARSGAINQGVATNTIRAVCIDDYLALYVNGEFVADTRDNTYAQGAVGLTGAVEEGATLEVAFDDLIVLEGTLH